MMTWIVDTISWLYYETIRPFVDIDFLRSWLLGGEIPLLVSLLVINSLFLIYRLFDSVGGGKNDWNSKPNLVLQTGLIVGNATVVGADAMARGWI